MKVIKVASGVVNQTPLDWDGNYSRLKAVIHQAQDQEVDVLCLPELAISGYGCEDSFHAPHVLETSWNQLLRLKEEVTSAVVIVGLPFSYQGTTFNVAAILAHQQIVGLVPKKFLAGDGIHYEPRWFKAWSEGVHEIYQFENLRIPIGDIYFDFGGLKLGLEICEEAWVPHRPGAQLALRGVDLIVNPSASHFAFDKIGVRKNFVIEGSRAFGVGYDYSNLLGNEAGRTIFDGGALIASQGKLIAQGPRFIFNDSHLTVGFIDVEVNRMARSRTGSFQPQLRSENNDCVVVPYSIKDKKLSQNSSLEKTPSWESSLHLKEEEFFRAVTLGLFDYLRKSRSKGFVVSLSGGLDSSVTSIMSVFALKRAFKELGENEFRKKLSLDVGFDKGATIDSLVQKWVFCVYQKTRNSGEVTLKAAKSLAEALSCDFQVWDVDAICESYKKMIEGSLHRELSWQLDDVALQNIQARVRSPGIWLWANLKNALLLSTSNRSEVAVGYATMDGDTSGGLAPLGGIDKAYLRKWALWAQTEGPLEYGPMQFLKSVTDQAPTAELRPNSSGQTDEKDLMPYEILDAIERLSIRDKKSPQEILMMIQSQFEKYDKAQIKIWVVRFFRLFSRNQWKRERYAPSFHLDDLNLDPKTWCRFPILSGGFEKELAALEEEIE
jgi:NAD+ synthase (glutamine-hydrolysing)